MEINNDNNHFNYNYVFIDNGLDYNKIARNDLIYLNNCIILENKFVFKNKIVEFLYRIHTSKRINNIIILPFQSCWNRTFFKDVKFIDNKPICFIFATHLEKQFNMKTFRYLRKKYPNCKIVTMRRDVIEVCLSEIKNGSVELLKKTFDNIYTIDNNDVIKYGFKKINIMCSNYTIDSSNDIPYSDIFFCGKIKDRIEIITNLYNLFKKNGLVCDFILLNDSKDADIPNGIEIINKPISYYEILQHIDKTNCILEITQSNISSCSARFLEAICYNKKLLTNFKNITKYHFYNNRYMKVIDDINDIDIDFIKRKNTVNYQYDNYYSPINIIKYIDKDLM